MQLIVEVVTGGGVQSTGGRVVCALLSIGPHSFEFKIDQAENKLSSVYKHSKVSEKTLSRILRFVQP